MEFFFMFIGLGFFIYVIWTIEAAEERQYMRKLNEQREFGQMLHTEEPPPEVPPKHKG